MAAYLERKKNFADRVAAMTAYLGADDCRASRMGRYFGDTRVRPCGVCDNCRSTTAPVADAGDLEGMASEIRCVLAEAALSPGDLAARFEGREDALRMAVEGLRREGKLTMDGVGRLVWKG
jgi:ATP-dependent DNA helicase RecQ